MIITAARRQFAELGYDRTSMRSIAGETGVDPALVIRFYKSKQQLFVQLSRLPFDAAAIIPEIASGAPEQVSALIAPMLQRYLMSPLPRWPAGHQTAGPGAHRPGPARISSAGCPARSWSRRPSCSPQPYSSPSSPRAAMTKNAMTKTPGPATI